jgi:NAD(P)H dehydrogenase (quinone)
LPQAVKSGQIYAATGQEGAAYVTREDCARAASVALASNDTTNKTLDITGGETVDGEKLAQILSEVVGKKITFVPITLDQVKGGLLASGMPPFVAELLASFDDYIARGHLSKLSNAYTKLTNKQPQSVKDFLAANRSQLIG